MGQCAGPMRGFEKNCIWTLDKQTDRLVDSMTESVKIQHMETMNILMYVDSSTVTKNLEKNEKTKMVICHVSSVMCLVSYLV